LAYDGATHKSLMLRGRTALNRNELDDAIYSFSFAYARATTPRESASAIHMKAIALRLNKQFEEARGAFEHALEEALEIENSRDRELKIAAIYRDFGMVFIDDLYADPAQALTMFTTSRKQFRILSDEVEVAVSTGFIGRAYEHQGRRHKALLCYKAAHRVLKWKHMTYQLNNLVHLVQLLNNTQRLLYMPRLLVLIVATGQMRRFAQIRKMLRGA